MQRIIIREQDLTSNVEGLSSYDVAYVPGFRGVTSTNNDQYFRKPTLFTNRYAFQAAIGGSTTSAVLPVFSEAQNYPAWESGKAGFPARAIPMSGDEPIPMFNANEVDLGYRIALYLLSLGIPVYYEVMNNVTTAGTYSAEYNYTKVDTTTHVFNSGLSYYTYIGSGGTQTGAVTPVTDNIPSDTISANYETFGAQVSRQSGLYTFTGVGRAVAGETPSVVVDWTFNGSAVSLDDYGITVSFTPEAEAQYGFNVLYKHDGDTTFTDSVAPGETGSKALAVNTASDRMTGFIDGITYYTMEQTETCPICVESMYAGLRARFVEFPGAGDETFDSVGDYSVKYITSGGYPTFEYASAADINTYSLMQGMIDMAARRGDSVALIDHTNNPDRDLYPSTLGGSGNSVIDIVRTVCTNITNASFGAMFTPWYLCSAGAISEYPNNDSTQACVPASVGYLSALAVQIRDYNPWLAVSGVTRGRVPNLTVSGDLHTVQLLTNNIADSYQTLPTDSEVAQISINPITYIRNVGYCLWGNRTLKNNSAGTTALSFLNIRGVVSDVKKLIYEASQNNLFEQNTDITWINFKSVLTPLLDRMVANYILQDYSIVRYLVDPETGDPVPAYKVLAVIKIQPINSIEVFDLTVQLENADVFVIEPSIING